MKWVDRIMQNKRPEYIANRGMAWPILLTRWFGLSLVLRFRSDESFEGKAECNRLSWLLRGVHLRHFEIPRLGDMKPAVPVSSDTYVYGNEFGLWGCKRILSGEVFYEWAGRRGGVELLDADRVEDRMVDFPNWMTHSDVIFDSDRQVVMLVLAWGPGWK